MTLVYLHGFASSPASKKARFFGERLRALGVDFTAPDLAEGNFAGLTLSKQLAVVERAVAARQGVHLMGSSMGGYLAALYAAAHPQQIARMVLMAPAFDFAARWRAHLGEAAFAEWERTGRLTVFHYGEGGEAQVGFELYRDALGYPAFPAVSQPALIFHGRRDDVVPANLSERFAALDPSRRQLRLLDSDHELIDVTDLMWSETRAFLESA